jgi:hypothetical protein
VKRLERPAGARTRIEVDHGVLNLVDEGFKNNTCLMGAFFLMFPLIGLVVTVMCWHTQQSSLSRLSTILFSGAWHLLVACSAICALFGSERLRVGPDGLEHTFQALVVVRRRSVSLREINAISYHSEELDENENQFGVEIETTRRPIHFAIGASAEEQAWLARLLKDEIERWEKTRDIPIHGAERADYGGTAPSSPSSFSPSDDAMWDRDVDS